MTGESITEIVARETVDDDDDATTPDDDENGENGDDDAPDVEPESAPAALAEQDWDRIAKVMERESVRHEKRVADILGAAIEDVELCPLCDFPGFVYPFHPGTDAGEMKRAAVASYMGDNEPDYKHAAHTETCATCDGFGVLVSGSKLESTRTVPCPACGALGWTTKATTTPTQPVSWSVTGSTGIQPAGENGQGAPDAWGRPAGHADYGRAPMFNPATGTIG